MAQKCLPIDIPLHAEAIEAQLVALRDDGLPQLHAAIMKYGNITEDYKEEEGAHLPYFCYVGANFISLLWTMISTEDISQVHNAEFFSKESIPKRCSFHSIYWKCDPVTAALTQQLPPQDWRCKFPTSNLHLVDLRGVFHCELLTNGMEGHGFVAYFTEETVTIYSSLGGVVGFFVSHHPRKEWCQRLSDFDTSESKSREYEILFGFTPGMADYLNDEEQLYIMEFTINPLHLVGKLGN